MNKTMFIPGLVIAVVAAALLLLDVIESGFAAGIGFVGICLIAASGGRKNDNNESESPICSAANAWSFGPGRGSDEGSVFTTAGDCPLRGCFAKIPGSTQ